MAVAACLLVAFPLRLAGQTGGTITEWRSDVRAAEPLAPGWDVEAHLVEYPNTQTRLLDELKAGAEAQHALGAWTLSAGWEHVVLRSGGVRSTEGRILVEANAQHAFSPWLTLGEHEKTEIRDMATGWATRWTDKIRADVGADRVPLVTPWIAREASYDARYRTVNKTMWWYGLRLRSHLPVETDAFFYDENDTRRAIHRLTAFGINLRYAR